MDFRVSARERAGRYHANGWVRQLERDDARAPDPTLADLARAIRCNPEQGPSRLARAQVLRKHGEHVSARHDLHIPLRLPFVPSLRQATESARRTMEASDPSEDTPSI